MGQSAWLNTSFLTLQCTSSCVNGGCEGRRGKPLIPRNLIIFWQDSREPPVCGTVMDQDQLQSIAAHA